MAEAPNSMLGGLRAVLMLLGFLVTGLFILLILAVIGLDLSEKGMRPGLLAAYAVVALGYLPSLAGVVLALREFRRLRSGPARPWMEVLAIMLMFSAFVPLLVILQMR